MINYRPTTWLSINFYGNAGWYFFKGQGAFTPKAFSYNISNSYDITLPRDYYLGAMYSYSHMPPTPQASYEHNHIYSFYAKKKLWDGRFEIGITAKSPFRKYGRFTATEQGVGFYQYRWNDIQSQSLGIKFVLNLSSGKKSNLQRDRSLEQSDLDHSVGVQ